VTAVTPGIPAMHREATALMLLAIGLLLLGAGAAWAQQYDHGDPTSDEQMVLEIINRARANPDAEGTRLAGPSPNGIPGGNIREGMTLSDPGLVAPRPPLAMNKYLLASARAHSVDMWTRRYFAHDTQAPPTQTWDQRIAGFGYTWNFAGGKVGENIAAGGGDPAAALEDLLMIDDGFPERGHRRNLLDVWDPAENPYREIGIGYYSGAAALPVVIGSGTYTLKDFLTQDFGRSHGGPFLLGVVYVDANANNSYDIGEGLPGVTITVSPVLGGYSTAVSAPGGGYAIPVGTSGKLSVTASGGPLKAGIVITSMVTLSIENVKLDFKVAGTNVQDTDADGIPDEWETRYGLDLINPADASADADGDGFSSLEEYRQGTNPRNIGSYPGSGSGLGGSTPPPLQGSNNSPQGAACGWTGLDAVLLLLLLRSWRRVREFNLRRDEV
jgi:hypothetical protein